MAGENRLPQHEIVLARAALQFERRAIGVRAEAVPGIEGVIGVADAAQEDGAVEGDAVGGVDLGVGVDERGLGVDDETVEVEDEGADHEVGRPSMLRAFFPAWQAAMAAGPILVEYSMSVFRSP